MHGLFRSIIVVCSAITAMSGAWPRGVVVTVVLASIMWARQSVGAPTIYATFQGAKVEGNLVTIDGASAAATTIGPTGTSWTFATAFAPDGTLYGTRDFNMPSNRFGRYDLATGVFIDIGPAQFGVGVDRMLALEVADDGTVFGGSRHDKSTKVWRIDAATGIAVLVGENNMYNVSDFAFASDGTLWAVNNDRELYTINPVTGAATFISQVAISSIAAGGISFDVDGTLYLTDFEVNSRLYRVNPVLGVATLVGPTSRRYVWGGDIRIPEPGALLLMSLSGLLACHRPLRARLRFK